jgi:hypothetical protein
MEVSRIPPYPIVTTWTLPIPNYEYIVYVEDLVDHSIEETTMFSDADGVLIYELPLERVQYDRKFFIKFYDTEHQHTLYEENLDVIRPYVNPAKLGTTSSEIEEYKMLELVARNIIDSVVMDGFYNNKHIVQTVGLGSDYFPVWEDPLNRVLKVYENNVLVYDIDDPTIYPYTYKVTLDNSAIERVETTLYNKSESTPLRLPYGAGNLAYFGYMPVTFPEGFDYLMILDIGFKAIPPDIEYATKLLIDDLKCGKLDYYNRYITSYNTDQFKIQFDKSMFDGTGNMIVDKILDKYKRQITKIGII